MKNKIKRIVGWTLVCSPVILAFGLMAYDDFYKFLATLASIIVIGGLMGLGVYLIEN